MRTLKFIVNGSILEKDLMSNFDDIVPNSENHLKAKFLFSKEWDGCTKLVGFTSPLGFDCGVVELKDGMISCDIPAKALKKRSFKYRSVELIDKVKR